MYFFSGEYTCLKVMPAFSLISVKRRSLGSATLAENDPVRDRITIGAISLTLPEAFLVVIAGCLISSLSLQLFRNFHLALPLSLPPGGNVRLAQLIMELRLFGIDLYRTFQIVYSPRPLTLLKQSFTQKVSRLGIVRPILNNLSNQLKPALNVPA